MQFGIKSVSMDDIASNVGVSKKTIYKHFVDKKALINDVMDHALSFDQTNCEKCTKGDGNAIQIMINLSKMVSESHKDMNPVVMYDVRKYYPITYLKIESFRNGFIKQNLKQNILQGQEEGLYSESIDPEIVSLYYITLIEGMMKQLSSKDNSYDFKTLHFHMVSYHLRGICTLNGLEYLENHINEIQ